MTKFKINAILLAIITLFFTACSEDGNSWSAKDVCPEDGVDAYGMPNRGTFTDERDGQVYKYTTIGDQVWMAQNLNHVAEYSACYDNDEQNCSFWGRLYSLQENGEKGAILDYTLVDSICPIGWHVPTITEWDILVSLFGKYNDESTAKKIKATELWNDDNAGGNGTDECGFRAIPAGEHDGWDHHDMYRYATFWASTMANSGKANAIIISGKISSLISEPQMSIRCIKD